MKVVTFSPIGRFANSCLQYLYARAYAEKYGFEFQSPHWVGKLVFDLHDNPVSFGGLPGRSELTVQDGEGDICFRDFYAQSQRAMIYTKKQAQAWLKLNPMAQALLEELSRTVNHPLAHLRRGDYERLGYPLVSRKSYLTACHKFGLDRYELEFVSEESPWKGVHDLPSYLGFLPDFLRLMSAPYLLRSNSSFSWLAGLLGKGDVFSPVIDGLGAGEHDVEFVRGNHKRFCNLDFVTDLHLPD